MTDDPFRRDEAILTTTPPDLAAPDLVEEDDVAAAADTRSSGLGEKQPTEDQGVTAPAISDLKETVGQVVEQAQGTAGEVLAGVTQQTTSRLAAQKNQVAATLLTTAQAVRQSSQQLRTQDQATIAGYIDTFARQAERLSTYLQNRDVQALVDDAERVARQRPALFVGSTVALGLLAARFFKSSRSQQGVIPSDRSLVPTTSSAANASSASSPHGSSDTHGQGTDLFTSDRNDNDCDAVASDVLDADTSVVRDPSHTFRAELPDDTSSVAAPKSRKRRSPSAAGVPALDAQGGSDADE